MADKFIKVEIPVEDALTVLGFLNTAGEVMRESMAHDGTVTDEINISVIERFKNNLLDCLHNQTSNAQIEEAIKYLTQKI